jgi:drug/metabolite transporter (DMT)-like permease
MIIFNKLVLSTWKFAFPCFLTGWHSLLATFLTQSLYFSTNLLTGVKEKKITRSLFYRRVLPIAFLFSISLVLANTAYQYISLGYIQMIKAITPVPLLLLYFATGKETPSVLQLLIVCLLCAGVIISSVGELQFSWTGFLLQVKDHSETLLFAG